MPIMITAEYASIIQPFVSKEETHYLNGFLVEPCGAGGVSLVATDGRCLLIIHDEAGQCAEPEIVQLEKETIAACRPAKNSYGRMLVLRNGAVATVTKRVEDYSFDDYTSNIVAFGKGERADVIIAQHPYRAVDGTFPDWRRVLPKEAGSLKPVTLSCRYIGDFAALGKQLQGRHGGGASLAIHATDPAEPALVKFEGVNHIVGILMPMRGDTAVCGDIPTWIGIEAPKAAIEKPKAAKKASKRKAA